jgi:hypothetical protein
LIPSRQPKLIVLSVPRGRVRTLGRRGRQSSDRLDDLFILGLGHGAEVEEDRTALDAGDDRRFAQAEGAGPAAFRLPREWERGADPDHGRRQRFKRCTSTTEEGG